MIQLYRNYWRNKFSERKFNDAFKKKGYFMEIEGFKIFSVAHIKKLHVDPECMKLFTIICIAVIIGLVAVTIF